MSNIADDRVLRIGELRKMISEMRKEYTPALGKMKRADLLAHYAQLKGLKPSKSEPKPTGAVPPKGASKEPAKKKMVRVEEEEETDAPVRREKKAPAPVPRKVREEEYDEEEVRPRGRGPTVAERARVRDLQNNVVDEDLAERLHNSSVGGFGMRAPARGRPPAATIRGAQKNMPYGQDDE
jgi:hypothetical protein